MEIEIPMIKIKNGTTQIELTITEAKELHNKLNEIFGLYLNTVSIPTVFNSEPVIKPPFEVTCTDGTSGL